MPATPTPWASIPLPAEGDLPDVPTNLAALATQIDSALKMLMTTGTASSTTMPTPASTGGANLLSVGSQIAGLTSTLSTLSGQVATLQSQVTALQHTPYAYSVQDDSTVSLNAGSVGYTQVLQTLNIPSQGYQRLLIAYGTGSWCVEPDTIPSTSPPMANVCPLAMALDMSVAGGSYATRAYSAVWSVDFTFSLTFMETIPAGSTAAIRQTINCPEIYHWPAGAVLNNWDDDHPVSPSRIYAVTIPWTGAALPIPS